MLVDGAIVVTEYADRQMIDGATPPGSLHSCIRRMAWPIIAHRYDTRSIFALNVLARGGREFMKYLPMTVLITLSASL
ncbi:MAG: hypothetical protein CM1200mP39_31070 [Dehalococcoidia bacterium]|nr:MAG: hypothetical protein CM1200mP39_31070 [Dehalococcoidia bacterium]